MLPFTTGHFFFLFAAVFGARLPDRMAQEVEGALQAFHEPVSTELTLRAPGHTSATFNDDEDRPLQTIANQRWATGAAQHPTHSTGQWHSPALPSYFHYPEGMASSGLNRADAGPSNLQSQGSPQTAASTYSVFWAPHPSFQRLLLRTPPVQPQHRLDAFFMNFLRSRHFENAWELPKDMVFIESPWFDASYNYLYRMWKTKRPPQRPSKPIVPPQVFHEVEQGRLIPWKFAYDAYRMTISPMPANGMQAGEVLLRYHHRVDWQGAPKPQSRVLSAWKTADGGSRLVFLGFYNAPQAFYEEVIKASPSSQALRLDRRLRDTIALLRPKTIEPLGEASSSHTR